MIIAFHKGGWFVIEPLIHERSNRDTTSNGLTSVKLLAESKAKRCSVPISLEVYLNLRYKTQLLRLKMK